MVRYGMYYSIYGGVDDHQINDIGAQAAHCQEKEKEKKKKDRAAPGRARRYEY